MDGNSELGSFRYLPPVLHPGGAKVRSPVSQNVKGVGGEYAERADRIRQLQRAFHRGSSFNVNVRRLHTLIGVEPSLDLELLPITFVCQCQSSRILARASRPVGLCDIAPGSESKSIGGNPCRRLPAGPVVEQNAAPYVTRIEVHFRAIGKGIARY